jgi:hypothetical protein
MPSAKVLPDWRARLLYSGSGPYRTYGAALGLFDRLEVEGQLTEVSTVQGFPGEAYGHYKDRSVGARLVLLPEDDPWPQVAAGAFDATGTGLFGSRYLVATKRLGSLDLTVGLGQGVLGGDSVPVDFSPDSGQSETGSRFLASSPWRRTRPFGGVEWHLAPRLDLVAEYSSIDYRRLFGYDREPRLPVNAGLRYALLDHLGVSAGLMRGRDPALAVSLDIPLRSDGLFPRPPEPPYPGLERKRWQAYEADNGELARLVAAEVKADGFREVAARCSDTALWIEAENARYMSDARALARLGTIADSLAPERIATLYLGLKRDGQVRDSLRTGRPLLRAYLDSRLDKDGYLAFADLRFAGDGHLGEFLDTPGQGPPAAEPDRRLSFDWEPKVRTFLNNRKGFLKNKALILGRGTYAPWSQGLVQAEVETVLYNDYDEVAFPPQGNEPVRTDLVRYERGYGTRLSALTFSQAVNLAGPALLENPQALVSAGWLESAFAGASAEVFAYFLDGRCGLGLESSVVRKRDPDEVLGLSREVDRVFATGFVNLYALLWPEQGVDAGLKVGRFLAGDPGARLQVRRTMDFFTVGAWHTRTDGSGLAGRDNRQGTETGVYVSVPLSVFDTRESRGRFQYGLSSFTTDAGQNVRRPAALYPMDDASLPDQTASRLDDMRSRK